MTWLTITNGNERMDITYVMEMDFSELHSLLHVGDGKIILELKCGIRKDFKVLCTTGWEGSNELKINTWLQRCKFV